MTAPSISVQDLVKIYGVGEDGQPIAGAVCKRAVDGVSFSCAAGERIGLIGPNGAGKSTLVSMLAGIQPPTSGEMRIEGHVTAIMTLGVGLRELASGRENIYLDAELQGKTRAEIEPSVDSIIRFSELEEAIDLPVRTYSTGMKARLAFSMLIHLDPEILIIDEALSAGDIFFAAKATEKIKEICARGKLVIVVSHSMGSIVQMCNRCIWMDNGRVVMDGPAAAVTKAYLAHVHELDDFADLERFRNEVSAESRLPGLAFGPLEITGEVAGLPVAAAVESGHRLTLRCRLSINEPLSAATLELDIVRRDGVLVYRGPADETLVLARGGNDVEVLCDEMRLGAGLYKAVLRLQRGGESIASTAGLFEVRVREQPIGGKPLLMWDVEHSVERIA